ncbi:MAG: YfiR family protein [Candidatus Acidiferrales bacterium]
MSSLRMMGIALTLFSASGLPAQQSKPSEYQVKAAYLFNFGKFVKWPAAIPAERDNSFNFCVLGQDPFGRALDSILVGENLGGKPVAIRRIAKPQDSGPCRILFISSTEENHLKEILAVIDESGVLTVSDMPGFSRRGGMIQFVVEGNKVRFEINLTSAENAKLTLSSELLKVAAAVRRNAPPGD